MAKAISTTPPVSIPIRPTSTIYGVLLNFRQDLLALGEAMNAAPYNAPPKAPILYIKPPNTFCPHGGAIPMPADRTALEASATLGLVIGRTATRVKQTDAPAFVYGYTIAIDVTVPHTDFFRPPVAQRCCDGFLPLGPHVVECAAVADPDNLMIGFSVNGEERCVRSTADLVRHTAQLIADVTDFTTLFTGDVLLVGVPLKGTEIRVGDRLGARIAGVGRLEAWVGNSSDAAP